MRSVQVVLRVLPLAAAGAVLAATAGCSRDGAPLYQRAAAEYRAGRPEEAVSTERQALRRRLSFPTVEQSLLQQIPIMPELPTMRAVARGNAAYALVLAKQGNRAAAMQLCDLTHAMAQQLLDDTSGALIVTLAAIALDQIGARGRTAALKAAGDAAGARALMAQERAMKAFVASHVKPSSRNITTALGQLTRQVAARGGQPDPRLVSEYALQERKIAADLAARWREGPGR